MRHSRPATEADMLELEDADEARSSPGEVDAGESSSDDESDAAVAQLATF